MTYYVTNNIEPSTYRTKLKKSSPTCGFIPIPASREKAAGFVLNSGAA